MLWFWYEVATSHQGVAGDRCDVAGGMQKARLPWFGRLAFCDQLF